MAAGLLLLAALEPGRAHEGMRAPQQSVWPPRSQEPALPSRMHPNSWRWAFPSKASTVCSLPREGSVRSDGTRGRITSCRDAPRSAALLRRRGHGSAELIIGCTLLGPLRRLTALATMLLLLLLLRGGPSASREVRCAC